MADTRNDMNPIRKLAAFFRRDKLEAEMSDELRAHLEFQIAENVRRGMPPDEARYAAERSFGGVEQVKERCRDERARGVVWLEHLGQDFSFAVRGIARSPGFAAVVVCTLALGIGVNAMIFSVFNAMVLKPAPVPDGAEVVRVHGFAADAQRFTPLTYPDFAEYQSQAKSFSGLAALGQAGEVTLTLAGSDEAPERINARLVSGNYFEVLKSPFAGGRGFRAEEDRTRGTHPVVVLSHGFWQRRFGGEPSIVGKALTLNGNVFTVVGVAGNEFRGTRMDGVPDLWVPMAMQPTLARGRDRLEVRDDFWLQVDGRLKAGVSRTRAQEEMSVIARRLDAAYPRRQPRDVRVLRSSLVDPGEVSGKGLPITLLTFAAPALLLLIVCANVGNLLLARGAARTREMAIRASLGADRFRLLRQLLTESVLFGVLGAAGGLLLTIWLRRGLAVFLLGESQTGHMQLGADANVFGYVFMLSLLTPLVFGLMPALLASRLNLADAMKQGGGQARGASRSRLQNAFIIGQVALSFVLLVVAGLLVRTLHRALTVDPGIEIGKLVAVSPGLGQAGYDVARAQEFHRALGERLRAHPAVSAAALTHYVPGMGMRSSTTLWLPDGRKEAMHFNRVSPEFFATAGMSLLAGRVFTAEETAGGAALSLVTEAAARRFWPGESPLGKQYRTSQNGPAHEVIGVVPNAPNRVILEDEPEFYQLLGPDDLRGATWLVRAGREPATLLPILAAEVRALDKRLRPNVLVVAEKAREQTNGERKLATLASSFGALALLLASIGLYGVVAFFASQRTAEIGLRLAVGASPRDITRLVLSRGVRLVLWGSLAGAAVAFASTRALKGMLFGVTPGDPVTFVGVAILLAAVALLAGWLPARRAAKVDPMVALRAE